MRGNDVRDLALGFPEAEERETVGPPDLPGCATSEPDTFFVPSYVGQHGWVGIRLERVDAAELAELIEDAWRATAPKRVVKAYDAADAG